ncbi:MAG: UbiD family decarboxylase [Candidatus Tectomicrobia bacterium]|uniref:UbiD family decarboxylase n=1 Tax=Tectimicrobiota bacterium TaxID=2528274 RepID=A0A932GS51_UNCTE|nr:UbiD family decarboxylase [Candidatus Tectomicrobia bacterium]
MDSLADFLRHLQREHPGEILEVDRPVSPGSFQVTALLGHLESRGQFPLVLFRSARNLRGEVSSFPLVTNVFATREKCAIAMGLEPESAGLALSLDFAGRLQRRLPPGKLAGEDAPVHEVVRTGEDADLRDLPLVRHHEMDPAPYVDMVTVFRDPEHPFYNLAFQRNMYKGPRRLGLYMAPRHSWQLCKRYHERREPAPVAIVVSHHPLFFLGCLNVQPFGTDDYEVVGGVSGSALRITPSATWGEDFWVPADADLIIEGEVPPGLREIEAPFGEWTGYYGPQRLSAVVEVKAITHRRQACFQDIFVSHRENWILGGIPKEGDVFNAIRGVVPSVRGVHFAFSGNCRLNCYVSIEKQAEGQARQAALMALASCDFIKNVIVVDADIDPFNEQEVLWAVATRCQPHEAVDIIRDAKGSPLDPSVTRETATSKMIIDATMPKGRPFASRTRVPAEALKAARIEDYVSAAALQAIPCCWDSRRSQ